MSNEIKKAFETQKVSYYVADISGTDPVRVSRFYKLKADADAHLLLIAKAGGKYEVLS